MSVSSHKQSSTDNLSYLIKVRHAYYLLWKDFIKAYSNAHVFKWSLWWAFATCGYLQVISYIQLLWGNAVKFSEHNAEDYIHYNGAIEAVYTIIGN